MDSSNGHIELALSTSSLAPSPALLQTHSSFFTENGFISGWLFGVPFADSCFAHFRSAALITNQTHSSIRKRAQLVPASFNDAQGPVRQIEKEWRGRECNSSPCRLIMASVRGNYKLRVAREVRNEWPKWFCGTSKRRPHELIKTLSMRTFAQPTTLAIWIYSKLTHPGSRARLSRGEAANLI